MSKKFTVAGVLSALMLAATAVGIAQSPPPATAPVAGNHFRAKQVLGTKILLQGNAAAGTVDDLVFDDAGNLEYMIVDNGGQLTTVPWEAAKFDLANRTAALTMTADQYKVIPTYTVTTYPTFYAPAYRTQIYRSYGLTPRELRRLERR